MVLLLEVAEEEAEDTLLLRAEVEAAATAPPRHRDALLDLLDPRERPERLDVSSLSSTSYSNPYKEPSINRVLWQEPSINLLC